MVTSTFSAGVMGVTLGTAATDFFTITGNASGNTRVTRVGFSFNGSAGIFDVSLIKRSTANTAGTSSIVTPVPHISSLSSNLSTVRLYSANPTLGTQVGIVRSLGFGVSPKNNAITAGPLSASWEFGVRPAAPIFLIGTNEVLALNFGGQPTTGLTFDLSIEWAEDT